MADQMDEAAAFTEAHIERSIVAARKPVPAGQPGMCEACCEDSLRLPSPTAPPEGTCTAEEAAAICRRYGVGSFSPERMTRDPGRPAPVTTDADPGRPCRTPTRADYLRMGVSAETLDSMGMADPAVPQQQQAA